MVGPASISCVIQGLDLHWQLAPDMIVQLYGLMEVQTDGSHASATEFVHICHMHPITFFNPQGLLLLLLIQTFMLINHARLRRQDSNGTTDFKLIVNEFKMCDT
jgi:hypothetical protein